MSRKRSPHSLQQSTESVDGVKTTSPGCYLREAREARGRSVEDIARKLNLATYVIYALEEDAYDKIGNLMFVKGYLRLYAREIAANQHEVMERFNKLNLVQPNPLQELAIAAAQRREARASDRHIRWITLGVTLGLIVLMTVWWYSQQGNTHLPAITQAKLQQTASPTTPTQQQQAVESQENQLPEEQVNIVIDRPEQIADAQTQKQAEQH